MKYQTFYWILMVGCRVDYEQFFVHGHVGRLRILLRDPNGCMQYRLGAVQYGMVPQTTYRIEITSGIMVRRAAKYSAFCVHRSELFICLVSSESSHNEAHQHLMHVFAIPLNNAAPTPRIGSFSIRRERKGINRVKYIQSSL